MQRTVKNLGAKLIKKIAVATAFGLVSVSSIAATIDFQDLTSGSCAYYGSGKLVSGGFAFVGNPSDPNLFGCAANVIGSNTSNALINANSKSILTMSKNDGEAFSLLSFFSGSRYDDFNPNSFSSYGQATGIDVIGQVVGGGAVENIFNFTSGNFQQFNLGAGFSNLSSVTFTAIGNRSTVEFLIDNIVVGAPSSVPEPASAALLGLGLAAFAASRRKSAKSKNV